MNESPLRILEDELDSVETGRGLTKEEELRRLDDMHGEAYSMAERTSGPVKRDYKVIMRIIEEVSDRVYEELYRTKRLCRTFKLNKPEEKA